MYAIVFTFIDIKFSCWSISSFFLNAFQSLCLSPKIYFIYLFCAVTEQKSSPKGG